MDLSQKKLNGSKSRSRVIPWYGGRYGQIWDKINNTLWAAEGLELVVVKWKKDGICHQEIHTPVLPFVRHVIWGNPLRQPTTIESLNPQVNISAPVFQVGHS